jgi:hypothetical protein
MNKRCVSFQVLIAGFMLTAALALVGCSNPSGGSKPKIPPTPGDIVDFDALNGIEGIEVSSGGGGGGTSPVITVSDGADNLTLPPLKLGDGVTATVTLPGGTLVSPNQNGSYTIPLDNLSAGNHEIKITLTDKDGTENTVTFVVEVEAKEPENPTPEDVVEAVIDEIFDAITEDIPGVTVTRPNDDGILVVIIPDDLDVLTIPPLNLPDGGIPTVTLPDGTEVELNDDGSFTVPVEDLDYGENEITITLPDITDENGDPVEIVLVVDRKLEIELEDILDALGDGVEGVAVDEDGVVLAGVDVSELRVFDIPSGFTVEYQVNDGETKTVQGPAALVIDLDYG